MNCYLLAETEPCRSKHPSLGGRCHGDGRRHDDGLASFTVAAQTAHVEKRSELETDWGGGGGQASYTFTSSPALHMLNFPFKSGDKVACDGNNEALIESEISKTFKNLQN